MKDNIMKTFEEVKKSCSGGQRKPRRVRTDTGWGLKPRASKTS